MIIIESLGSSAKCKEAGKIIHDSITQSQSLLSLLV